MTTPVKFEIAKLLKEKGFDKEVDSYYSGKNFYDEQIWFNYNDKTIGDSPMHRRNAGLYSAPTIAEVVMWLYEKHEYWCYTYTNGKIWHPCIQHKFGDIAVLPGKIGQFNSPTEVYEAAIEYTLNNLI